MLGLVVALIPRQCGCGNVAAPGYCCSTNSSSNPLIFCARSGLQRALGWVVGSRGRDTNFLAWD